MNILEKHIIKKLSDNGFVLVLNTEAKIDGQAEAMLQALHSRSTGGIKNHLSVLEEKGAENFMERFYVGYGHKSIGDCGSATVFVEGISMLAAKAIQDWRLYSGQEASTRYVDFSDQKFLNPAGTKEGEEILENWRKFYLDSQDPVREHLKKQFPKNNDEDQKIYDKAIMARAFDITRSFLPAGATTNVAWRMNFRQFADELMLLRHHPLKEIRDIAEKTEEALRDMYTSSFGQERFANTEDYNKKWMQGKYYYKNDSLRDFTLLYDNVDRKMLSEYKNVLESRPIKTELPMAIAECGMVGYEFLLDFGSFRDLQRHRAIVQRMPLLNLSHGFNEWYLKSLPDNLREKTEEFIKSQEEKIKKLGVSEEGMQYYVAMGYKVPCRLAGDLKALVYLVELRSTRFVHPTLVEQILKMIKSLKELFAKDGLVLHLDEEPNRFDIRRGQQDIVEK
ncbi:MAG TPA: FAD-dependent thymidylate synthase [Candidatus Moranbacteria bacterium]|nr:FAD-dependent thymidylate synthase [Candidatus Moranbacteria bacterium]HRZ33928.1 FAD-dependent thymidylate synthase [Candidatus Moranbacteria bacterium]